MQGIVYLNFSTIFYFQGYKVLYVSLLSSCRGSMKTDCRRPFQFQVFVINTIKIASSIQAISVRVASLIGNQLNTEVSRPSSRFHSAESLTIFPEPSRQHDMLRPGLNLFVCLVMGVQVGRVVVTSHGINLPLAVEVNEVCILMNPRYA